MSGRTRLMVVLGWLVLVAAVAACGDGAATTTDGSVSTATIESQPSATAPLTTATPTTIDDPTTTTTAAADTTRGSALFSVPFRFQVPEGSTLRGSGQSESQALFVQGRNEYVIFLTRDLDAWLQRLSDKDATVSDEFPVAFGGIDGAGVDVVAAESFTLTDSFGAESGDAMRIVAFNVEGVDVSIAILTAAANFEVWTPQVEEILQTIEWGVAP